MGNGIRIPPSGLCASAPLIRETRRVVFILQEMGAKIPWDRSEGVLEIEGRDLSGVEVDASLTPDLVPTIAVLGAVAEGRTVVRNAEHVRHKETDRLRAMAVELSKMGAKNQKGPTAW